MRYISGCAEWISLLWPCDHSQKNSFLKAILSELLEESQDFEGVPIIWFWAQFCTERAFLGLKMDLQFMDMNWPPVLIGESHWGTDRHDPYKLTKVPIHLNIKFYHSVEVALKTWRFVPKPKHCSWVMNVSNKHEASTSVLKLFKLQRNLGQNCVGNMDPSGTIGNLYRKIVCNYIWNRQ